MNDSLKQLHVSYQPVQDRLLLILCTQDDKEFRLWITRRYLRVLWPALMKALESDPDVAGRPDQTGRRAVLEFQHEKALAGARFTKDIGSDERVRPFGDTPLLASRAQVSLTKDGRVVLGMQAEDRRGIRFTLEWPMVHSLCHLIGQSLRRSGWDFALKVARAASAPAAGAKIN